MPPDPVSPARALDVMTRYYRILNEHDLARIPEMYVSDIRLDDDAWHEPIIGHAGVRVFLDAFWRAFPDIECSLVEDPYVAGDGDRVVAWVRGEGTHSGLLHPGFAATGRRFVTEFASFYTLDGDRMRYGRVIGNPMKTAQQLGLLPRSGSRAETLLAASQRMQTRVIRSVRRRRA